MKWSGSKHRRRLSVRALSASLIAGLAVAGSVVGTATSASAANTCNWGGYSNGSVPLSAMTIVSGYGAAYWNWSDVGSNGDLGQIYLESNAANSLTNMLVA